MFEVEISALRVCDEICSTDCHTEINSAQAGFCQKPRNDELQRKARPLFQRELP